MRPIRADVSFDMGRTAMCIWSQTAGSYDNLAMDLEGIKDAHTPFGECLPLFLVPNAVY
jgi:hypothetical protein